MGGGVGEFGSDVSEWIGEGFVEGECGVKLIPHPHYPSLCV